MKYFLLLIMIFYGKGFNEIISAEKINNTTLWAFFIPQQAPFYFLKPIPPAVKLMAEIDLSFFRNQSIVTQYRYRLEIPNGGQTAIERALTRWSPWMSFNYIEIIIPVLDREGGYKFMIEYRTSETNEISKYENLFYVYRVSPGIYSSAARSKKDPVTDRTPVKKVPATEKPPAKQTPVHDKSVSEKAPVSERSEVSATPLIDKISVNPTLIYILSDNENNKEKEPSNDLQSDTKDLVEQEVSSAAALPEEGEKTVEYSSEPVETVDRVGPDYNKLLAEAVEKKDTALFRKSVRNGAGSELKGQDGGNIFHVMGDALANEDLVYMLKNMGIPINEPDNHGNSPLHVAILSGESAHARSLMNQGADLNIKNKLELSPLHLAAILNNEEVANNLMIKGAEINIKGNYGYTPLHIASELNYISLAKSLLNMGAKAGIKTNQKLTARAIANIQNNYEMNKLLAKKGSYALNTPRPASINGTSQLNYPKLDPKYEFPLPFDEKLAQRRQFNKVVQIISIPVFAGSAAGLSYFKSLGNRYHSLSKIAETEEMGRTFYNNSIRFDTYAYISGGISLVSVYGFINSTIRKKNTSRNMHKNLNQVLIIYE